MRYTKNQLIEDKLSLLKRFKIIADYYRNRRKRFGLRSNLIAEIYNLDYGIGSVNYPSDWIRALKITRQILDALSQGVNLRKNGSDYIAAIK